jgi:hypothetical protein
VPPFSKQRKGLEGNEKNNLMIPKKKELQINKGKKTFVHPHYKVERTWMEKKEILFTNYK